MTSTDVEAGEGTNIRSLNILNFDLLFVIWEGLKLCSFHFLNRNQKYSHLSRHQLHLVKLPPLKLQSEISRYDGAEGENPFLNTAL